MGRAEADRNLLFGILALQMDFIARDSLIAAMHAWVLEKHRTLGEILMAQGLLTTARHDLLAALVAEHIRLHGNDPARSLAALSSIGSARRDLEAVPDPELHASLAQVSADRHAEEDPYATRCASVGPATASGTRFRILRPYARGGLGVVSVALDTELDRQVALKEIQDRHADDAVSRARFILEAEITGKLEHPGVVPVYGLGQYADGRPFYAMRFIRGDNLKDAVRRYHQAGASPSDTDERRLQFRELLGRFLDVCEAIEYAHSRGVLHRDLKPGNVMLGPFGETLVVDWGLAVPTGRAAAAAASAEGPLVVTSASGCQVETAPGSVVGTPAYMSPEQAAGRLDELGPATDVYSLGATLYQILTGKTPYEGTEPADLLRTVERGDFLPPSRVKVGVPRALEAITLKAMALRPGDRYRSPRELAQDIKRWLADEPVTAWREPWSTRLRRWLARHRTAVATVAAASLVAVPSSSYLASVRRDIAAQNRLREIERKYEREKSDVLRYESLVDRTGQAMMSRRPGWRRDGLGWIAEAAKIDTAARDLRRLRELSAACLGGVDIAEPTPAASLNAFCLAFSPDGRRLAAGQYHAAVRVRVDVLDVATRRTTDSFPIPNRGVFTSQGGIRALAFSPDGRWLVAGTKTGEVHAYDTSRPGMPPREMAPVHKGHVVGFAFTPDGKWLICASSETKALTVWEVGPEWRLLATKPLGSAPEGLSLSRDGKRLALSSGAELSVLSVASLRGDGPAQAELRPLPGACRMICCSPDGRVVAASVRNGIVLYSDAEGRLVPLRRLDDPLINSAHSEEIHHIEFSPDGALLVSGAADRTVKVWEVATGRLVATIPVPGDGSVYPAFAPDGRMLAITEDGRALLHRIEGFSVRRDLALDALPLRAVSFGGAPDPARTGGRLVGIADAPPEAAEGAIPVELVAWEVDAGPDGLATRRSLSFSLGVIRGREGPTSIAHHPLRALVAYGRLDGLFLQGLDESPVERISTHPFGPVAFSPDGSILWGIDNEDDVVVARRLAKPRAEIGRWANNAGRLFRGNRTLLSLAVGGRWGLVGTAASSVVLLRDEDLHQAQSWPADGPVHAVAMSADGTLAAWGTLGGSIRVVRVPRGGPVEVGGEAHRDLLYDLAFSPDGTLLATASRDRTIKLLAARPDGTFRRVLTLGAPSDRPVLAVRFGLGGRLLAALVQGEYAVRVWDLELMQRRLREFGLEWE
jgi:serine/threonine protein kinase/WD40 repeat protein